MSPIKRRPVTTAFIQDSEGKLLFVQRSSRVSTYQMRYGGVSGGVEGNESVLDRALQEVGEYAGVPKFIATHLCVALLPAIMPYLGADIAGLALQPCCPDKHAPRLTCALCRSKRNGGFWVYSH